MTDIHSDHPADTPKMIRETLCIAQWMINNFGSESSAHHSDRIARLINDIDRQRPLGPDGKHGNRHTATCGCEDE